MLTISIIYIYIYISIYFGRPVIYEIKIFFFNYEFQQVDYNKNHSSLTFFFIGTLLDYICSRPFLVSRKPWITLSEFSPLFLHLARHKNKAQELWILQTVWMGVIVLHCIWFCRFLHWPVLHHPHSTIFKNNFTEHYHLIPWLFTLSIKSTEVFQL